MFNDRMASTDAPTDSENQSPAETVSSLDSTLPRDGEVSITDLEEENSVNGHGYNSKLDKELTCYGFSLAELYTLSVQFYKRGREALNLSYHDKLLLTAYWKQISAGSYDDKKLPEIGYLDVIGNDRRKAWQALGGMSATEAMERFCMLLKDHCKQYIPYMEAQKRDKDEKERIKREAIEKARREEEERRKEEERKRREEELKRLEEEEQKRKEEEIAARAAAEEKSRRNQEKQQKNESNARGEQELSTDQENSISTDQDDEIDESTQPKPGLYGKNLNGLAGRAIAPASLWTRPKLQDFISHVKRDASSVVVVGRGETVTIRVPTHENGSCLFWEFATDSYDVGFGVYFEWSSSPSHDVSVNVDESDEDSDYDITKEDTAGEESKRKPLVDEVLPVLRRNSHKEVIVGSHIYPGNGVYLLKFDNSYSLLRSKTLYYRVYYTR